MMGKRFLACVSFSRLGICSRMGPQNKVLPYPTPVAEDQIEVPIQKKILINKWSLPKFHAPLH